MTQPNRTLCHKVPVTMEPPQDLNCSCSRYSFIKCNGIHFIGRCSEHANLELGRIFHYQYYANICTSAGTPAGGAAVMPLASCGISSSSSSCICNLRYAMGVGSCGLRVARNALLMMFPMLRCHLAPQIKLQRLHYYTIPILPVPCLRSTLMSVPEAALCAFDVLCGPCIHERTKDVMRYAHDRNNEVSMLGVPMTWGEDMQD